MASKLGISIRVEWWPGTRTVCVARLLSTAYSITPSTYVYISFVSDLVLASRQLLPKRLGKLYCSIACCTGCILRGHLAFISPRYVVIQSFISCLPIFLHGCDIKFGSGLGTRLASELSWTGMKHEVRCTSVASVVSLFVGVEKKTWPVSHFCDRLDRRLTWFLTLATHGPSKAFERNLTYY